MKKLVFAALAAGIAMIPTAALAQRAPAAAIIVVDSDRIYRECTACRSAQQSLQAQLTALQNRQQTLQNQLRPEAEALQKAVEALAGKQPDAALKARAAAFQQKEQQANQELTRSQQNIQAIQANVVRQINERMNPIINQVMTQKGANLALDVGSTMAHAQAVDATNDVLASLNQQLPAVSLTPLPQQQQPGTQGR